MNRAILGAVELSLDSNGEVACISRTLDPEVIKNTFSEEYENLTVIVELVKTFNKIAAQLSQELEAAKRHGVAMMGTGN